MISKTFRVFYQLIPSAIGEIGILWVQNNAAPLIMRIMLPQKDIPITKTINKKCPDALEQSHKKLKKLCLQIQKFLEGSPVSFSLKFINIAQCYDFQKKVLLETWQIPRGKVSCYGRLADRILAPRAARAVGSALAKNPFPLIIPCHRVVKSTGYLGNFGGGPEMKRFLLQMEGVPSNTRGKIGPEYFQK
ncbi:MAG: MGMT family protein [Desulfobacteraceae bacterium]|nr:MGMT family protein [Pseudomonadota bacterium]MBU4463200.1 MGMT family protein [Pseudomonadota bacterium]MCG2754229.1 MGMT family protein [Desulfobacteraceae bacterium]